MAVKTGKKNARGGIEKVGLNTKDASGNFVLPSEQKRVASYTTTSGEKKVVTEDTRTKARSTQSASSFGTPVISSQQGKNLVTQADQTMANLSPITSMPTTPVSEGAQQKNTTTSSIGATTATGTTPTTSTQTTPDNTNDFETYVNEQTGQEWTIKGSGITDEARKKITASGGVLASSEISGVKTTPEIAKLKREVDSATRESDAFTSRLESMLITDKELRGEIKQISSAYKARQAEMREINERRQVAMETLGVRTGMRYTGGTGGVMGGILSEEERQGLMRIESIENDKQDAILQAKKAARDQNFTLYTTLAQKAEKMQEKKATELQALKKAQAEQDAKIAEQKQQMEYDALIMEQLSTGETDPLKIVQALSGKVPFDQIKEITELMPKKEYQFVAGTENQASGIFDKTTGKFTPTGGGGGGGGSGNGVVNPQAQYWAQLINQGRAKLDDINDKNLRNAVVQQLASGDPTMTKANEQAYAQAQTALTAIDSVLTGIKEAGIAERTLLSKLPGSLARDINNSIETVQALIGFDALAQMRAASPTGGALGSITEKELRYLQSVQGSLDPLQSTEKLKTTITAIRKSFARIRAINSVGTTAEEYKKQFPDATEEELKEIRARQTTKEVQDNSTMSNKDLFSTGAWANSNTTTDGTDVFQFIGLEE